MAEAIQATTISPQARFLKTISSPDIQFAICLVAIIFTMILPLPPLVLDFLLSLSITIGFLILLVSIYVRDPLQF